jgi:hypothetical protein
MKRRVTTETQRREEENTEEEKIRRKRVYVLKLSSSLLPLCSFLCVSVSLW